MNTEKKPLHNAFIVLPALFLIFCGCPLAQWLTNEPICGIIVFGLGALVLVAGLLSGQVKMFG